MLQPFLFLFYSIRFVLIQLNYGNKGKIPLISMASVRWPRCPGRGAEAGVAGGGDRPRSSHVEGTLPPSRALASHGGRRGHGHSDREAENEGWEQVDGGGRKWAQSAAGW